MLYRFTTSDHEYIPKGIMEGTGGLIWNRILSFCTQELGGKVTGHDHSHGQGAWMSNSDQIIEYPYCDKFYVWTRNQKLRCVEMFHLNLPLVSIRLQFVRIQIIKFPKYLFKR